MKKMVRGVDLDDSAVGMIYPLIRFYNDSTGEKVRYGDFKSYNLWEAGIGRNREEAIQWVEKFYDSSYFDNMRLMDGAGEVIKKWIGEGEVYFITSRLESIHRKTREFVEKKFGRNSVKVMFSGDFNGNGKTKKEICREEVVKELVEDNLRYARECGEVVERVFVPIRPWNSRDGEDTEENIIRVASWGEIDRLTRGIR